MATKYQSNNSTTTTPGSYGVIGDNWRAMTFTPTVGHSTHSVKLVAWRGNNSPGTITVSVRATDGSGHPTGADLVTGTFNGDNILVYTAGSPADITNYWFEVTLTGYGLQPNTKYAYVVRVASSDYTLYIAKSNTSYATGNDEYSTDAGASWGTGTSNDWFFEDWGNVFPSDALTRVTTLIHLYNRGIYTLELGLGEVIADFGLPEWESKPRTGIPEPSFQERMERTAKQLEEEADMSREESLRIARKLETMEELTRREQGDRQRIPTTPPVQKKSFTEFMEEAVQAGLSLYEARKVAQYEEESNR